MLSIMRLLRVRSSDAGCGETVELNHGRRHFARIFACCAIILSTFTASASSAAEPTLEGKRPVGTVELREVQAAYIGSGTTGNGLLHFRGKTYPFTVSGLGAGGIGLSKIEAAGDVYGLENVDNFPGEYAEGRVGFAVGETSAGEMWLQNNNGVVLHLEARREGLMLSLGADVMVITMAE
jgi:hypothetical protein